MFTVSSNFIGEFKTGDNINYNLEVLQALYEAQATATGMPANRLSKPIIVLIAAIIEALLHDLIWRMQKQPNEASRVVANEILDEIQSNPPDKFYSYIEACRDHQLLGDDDPDIYDELHELRIRRNRIHIQNARKQLENNETAVFTLKKQVEAEELAERVISAVADRFPRPNRYDEFVDDFELPWDRLLTADST